MKKKSSLRVLLIEDDEDDYILVRGLLAASNLTEFKLDWVDSYDAGLDAVCSLKYDAYLLDYFLGGRTGLELLSEAGGKGCDVPVILLTSQGGYDVDLQVMQAGAAEHLVKNEINASILERSIRYAIDRKKTEQELKQYKHHLEELVLQRTTELEQTNLRLRKEIEERERAEYALRGSEEKFRTLVENSLDIIFTVSIDGIILSINPAFEKITGWSADDWVGKNYLPLIHPEDVPILRERKEEILSGRDLPSAEVRIRTKSGDIKVLEIKSTAQHQGDEIVGLIGTASDQTDRKKAEEQILNTNRFFNSVLESLSHPFYVIDAQDYSIVLANSAAAPNGIFNGTKCYSLFHKGDIPCSGTDHQCPLEDIKKSKKPLITEHIHYDHKGDPHYVEIHAHPIFDQAGEVSKIIEYCLDITDRKTIEEDLRRAQEQLESRVQRRTAELAMTNRALLAEIAERKRVEEALRLDEIRLETLLELSQMAGASEKQIADYVLEQQIQLTRSQIGSIGFLDEDERIFTLHAWSREVMEDCTVSEDTVHFEIEKAGVWADAVRKRKPITINDYFPAGHGGKGLPIGHVPLTRLMSIPIFEEDRVAAVAMVANKQTDYDQSDLRQLTLLTDGMWKLVQRERSSKALRESENLAGIGRALSSVAHDMKTPLIAIGGFTKIFQNHTERNNPDWEKMDIVLKETRRLENMVKDMLDFSKPLDLEKSPADIGVIVGECLTITKPLAEKKKVELRIIAPSPVPPVNIDGARIKQAIINLVTNAVQASPEGQRVKLGFRKSDQKLIIDVSDCGGGIPVEMRKEIFSPFFSTKKGGTGLGLPIVRKIVEAHKGRVEIVSNAEEGVTFVVVLPIA